MKRTSLLYILLTFFIGNVFAGANIELSDGTTYENAEVKSVEYGAVILIHTGGVARIPVEHLTPENRALLHLKLTPDIAKLDFLTIIKSLRESAAILQKRYRDSLQNLEKKTIAAGEVDAVVEIRSELAKLPKMKPESKIQFRDLRETRKEHIARSVEKQSELVDLLQEALKEYRETLQSLVDEFATFGKVVEAAALKSEIDRIAAMANNPKAALVTLEVIPAFLKPAKLASENPKGSSGRIVILPLTETAKTASPPSTFAAVEKENHSDIVGIGRMTFPNIGGILADGNLVYWNRHTPSAQIVPGANIKCVQFHGLPFIGLDQDGTLNFTSDSDPDTLSALAEQTDILDMAATYNAIALVSSDSRVSVVGSNDDHAHTVLLEDMKNVRSVGFSGFGFVTVLNRDGTVVKMRDGEAELLSGIDHIERLSYVGIGETKSGSLVNLGATPQVFINEVGANPRQTFRENKLFCAIGATGEFHCQLKGQKGELHPVEAAEKALTGALAFAPIHGPNDAIWIAAILPLDEVERSGLWVAEELIEARR